jgi:Tfp pilus assembly protein PilE
MGKMFIYNQMRLQKISNNKGLSLVAVVIVMLIVATLALFIASSMSSGNIAAITDMQAEQAFYIAQAGMEWYLEQLDGTNNWKNPPTVKTNQAFGAGTFSISYANADTKDIDVTSTGKVTGWDGNTVQRVITCHVNKQGQVMATSLWQEAL